MRPSKSLGPRSSLTSYGTSDDDVFYEPVRALKIIISIYSTEYAYQSL